MNELALKRDESRCSDRDRVAEVTATERQVAVVCLRPSVDHGAPEVLLIANARTGEWCIPKGAVGPLETPRDAASRDARMQGGVIGDASNMASEALIDPEGCRVEVHRVLVRRLLEGCPKSSLHPTEWVPVGLASSIVANPALASILDLVPQG